MPRLPRAGSLAVTVLFAAWAAQALAAETRAPVAPATSAPAPAPPAAAAPAPARRLITVEDVTRFRDVKDPRVSPDGRWVAYTVTTQDLKADKRQTDVWMTSWDGATTLQLTRRAKESASAPRFSPDGRHLAFLSSRGDENESDQVWLLPLAGGEAAKLTELKQGVSDFAWSPDGSRFVLAVSDTDSVSTLGAAEKDKTPPPILIDRFYFKEDVTGYVTRKRTHLFLFDLATRKAEQLTSGEHDDLQPAWSPDGRSIAFLSKQGPDADRTSSWEIFVVEARAGAQPRQVTRFEGIVNNPGGENRIAWSPDGSQIAFLQGGPPKLIYYALTRPAVVPAAGGGARVLTPGLDQWTADPAWSPDGKYLYVQVEEDRSAFLARVPAAGGAPEPVLRGAGVVGTFDVGASGRAALILGTPGAPREVYALEGGAARQLSHQNDSLMAALKLSPAEKITFKSRDGTEIHGFLVKPADYREGARHPTILRIHGGPVGQFQDEFASGEECTWQLLAANGYAVVAANPRGSSGRGQKFSTAIYADWGNKDAQDVLAAVDYAVALGVADPDRLGLGGWSYGGMLTNYVIAQDRRFKAAVSGASISNILAGYGTDMYVREYESELGPPWTAADKYLRVSSPFLHADRIVTPTLFMCGQQDFNVPLLNTEQMYQALKSLGRETQMVIYPGQNHGFRRPSYIQDRLRRWLDWYGRFLKPKPAAAPTGGR
ncbi:MAG: S9 family peptidase [Candidatus Eisenbacteria bacterium]|nr:S9 family peptidase [Candidatus Eisenbacteria bacterium]